MDYLQFIDVCLPYLVLVQLTIAAISDIRSLKIPNRLVLCVLAVVAVHFALLPPALWLGQICVGLLVFVVTAALFFLRMIGGGDAKLLAVLGLWVAPDHVMQFLLVMTIFGALLSLSGLVLMRSGAAEKLHHIKIFQSGWMSALSQGRGVVPYGVAIAAAGFWHVFLG